MVVECASCGGRFTAKRPSAKYCSPRCRQRAKRAPDGPPPRVEGAQITALPPRDSRSEPRTDGLEAAVRSELEEAGRLSSADGQAALALARIVDEPGANTASAVAAAARECRASLASALKGAAVAETPLQAMRRKRAERLTS